MANDQPQNGHNDQQNQSPQETEQPRPANRRRKRTIRFVLLALLILAIVIGIPIYAYYSVRESTDDAQVDGHLVPISARIDGTILEVLVNDNQPVRAGQELVKLDPADYHVAFDQAQAQLATSEANTTESQENVPITTINTTSDVSTTTTQVEEAQAAVASAQQAVQAAQARVTSANSALQEREANFSKAQKDLVRFQDLVQKDEISKQDFDAAVANAESNRAQVDSAKADIVTAQRTYDQAVAQLGKARARLATAQVQRRQSQQVSSRQQAVAQARYKQAQAQVQQRRADVGQRHRHSAAGPRLEADHRPANFHGVRRHRPGRVFRCQPGRWRHLDPLQHRAARRLFRETLARRNHRRGCGLGTEARSRPLAPDPARDRRTGRLWRYVLRRRAPLRRVSGPTNHPPHPQNGRNLATKGHIRHKRFKRAPPVQ